MMKENTMGQKFLAIMILVAFLMSSIPMMAISAQSVELVDEEVGTDDFKEIADSVEKVQKDADQEVKKIDQKAEKDLKDKKQKDEKVKKEKVKADEKEVINKDIKTKPIPKDKASSEPVRTTAPSPKGSDIKTSKTKTKNANRHYVASSGVEKNTLASNSASPPIISSAPSPPIISGTEITGPIMTQTWTVAGSPYWITGNVTIPVGQTLDIDPGVQVFFNGSFTFVVEGTMNAIGTSLNEITFTSNPQIMTLSYDDGGFESEQNGTAVVGDIIANAFNPSFPSRLESASFYVNSSPSAFDITVRDGVTGLPIVPSIPDAGPAGTGWHDVDLSAQNIILPSTFGVGVEYTNAGMPLIGEDLTTPGIATMYYNGTWYGPGFFPGTLGIRVNITPLPQPGDYPGIEFRAGSSGKISNCNISYAWNALVLNGTTNMIEIDNNLIYYTSEYGIFIHGSASSGFNIHDNTFNTTDYAIYGDVYFVGTGDINAGPITISRNTVTSSYGFNLDKFEFDSPTPDSNIVVGQLTISNNTFTNSMESIYVDDFNVINMVGGSVNWGNIVITDNDINQTTTLEGIYFSGIMDTLTDVVVNLGACDFSRNTIVNAGTAIVLDYWNIQYLHGTTSVFGNPININDNVINTTNNEGIYLYLNRLGYYMYDTANVILSDVTIDPNIINSDSVGIFVEIENLAYEMYDDTWVSIGDFYITDNDVISNNGIYFYLYDTGYNMYDNAVFMTGDFFVTGNDVTANGNAIYFKWEYCGYEMYNNTEAHLGQVYLNNNILDAVSYGIYAVPVNGANNIYGNSMVTFATWEIMYNDFSGSDGIYAGPEYVGYYLYDNSVIHIDDWFVMYNFMNITGYGLNYEPYDCGETMYDNSSVFGGDHTIMYNEVNTTGNNAFYLYYDYFAYDMYDDSFATFGLMNIQWNNFTSSGDDAVYLEIYYLGAYMYDNSIGFFEEIIFMNNDVVSTNGDGIYFYEFYENGYYNEDDSYLRIDDVLVTNNNIWASGDGIYIDDFFENGYYLYGNAIVEFGNFDFNDNIIHSGGSGFYIDDWYEWGAYMYDFSRFTMGHIEFNDNYINSSGADGIYLDEFEYFAYYMNDGTPGSTYFSMGNIEFCRNTIISPDYGLYLDDFDYLGAYMYYSSEAYFGDFLFNDNDILVDDATWDYGIYIYGFYYMFYYNEGSSYVEFGNVEINRNSINSSGYGIEFDYLFGSYSGYECYDTATGILGYQQINDNWVNASGSDGIYLEYLYEAAYYMYDSSYFEIGNIESQRNTILSGDMGLYLGDWYENAYNMYGSSIAIFGDFLFTNNTISASSEGIYIYEWYYWGYDMYDNSYAYFGDYLVNDNDIISGGDGIYMYYIGDSAAWMYDNSVMIFGDIEFNRNTIDAGSYGIDFDYAFYDVGYYNYGNSWTSWGHYQVNDNIIQADSGDGIYFYDFEYIGYELDDNAYFEMGNVEIQRNTINASSDGIYLYFYELACYLDDNSEVRFGDFLFNDNAITAEGIGIYVDYWEYMAYNMYNAASAYFGDIEFCNNIIDSVDDGMYFYNEYWAYGLYGDYNVVEFGHYFVNDNIINSSINNGIYIGYFYDIGYDLGDDDSDVIFFTMGDVQFCRNTINASGDGIEIYEWYEWAYDLQGIIRVEFGDFLFNDNNIISGDNGFYINNSMFYYFGELLYVNSEMTYGDIEFNRNTINAGGDGFYAEDYFFSDVGYDLNDASSVMGGHFEMNHNSITAGNYGIYLYDLEYVGAYIYINSHFEMQNFEICYNDIVSMGDDGIYFGYADYWGYDMNGMSSARFGDFLINWNTVNASGYGIYVDDFYYMGSELYNFASMSFGNIEMNNNTILATDTGLYLDDYGYYGYGLYGNNVVTFGHFQVNDNHIVTTTSGGDGIYFYGIYDLGENMYYDSYFEMGNVEFNRNYINASNGNGYYADYIEYWGYDLYDNSMAVFGDFQFNDNTILCVDYGMYVYDFYYYSAYNFYGTSSAYYGDIQFNRNYINSTNDYGMYFDDMYSFGSYLYDDSHVYMGNVEFYDNEIYAWGNDGIRFDDIYEWGYGMYGNSSFMMGDFNFINNTIYANGDGIYFEPYDFGASQYDDSVAIIGENWITDNTIYAYSGDGLYVWWWYEFGYYMYDNSFADIGGSYILRNTIEASGYGIETGPYDSGEYVYTNSRVLFGDYIVNDNVITCDGNYGIDFYYYDVGYDIDGTSVVEMGVVEINNNQITALYDEGINIYYSYVGYDAYENARVVTGDIYIRDNTIVADSYGIDIYYNRVGYSIYGQAIVGLGMFDISGNTITTNASNTNSYGIYVDARYVGYDIYNFAELYIGDLDIYDNNIVSSYYGLYFKYYDVGYTYDDAYARIPAFLAHDMTVNANDTALYVESSGHPNSWVAPSVQDWPDYAIEVYNCDFTDGDAINVTSDNSTQPILWVHDSTFTNVAVGNSTMLQALDVGEMLVEYTTFTDYKTGIEANNSYVIMGSCDLPTFTNRDINMSADAWVFMVDTPFNKANILFQDNASILDIGWYITINTVSQVGTPIPMAVGVSTSNASASPIWTDPFVTDMNGQRVEMLREYRENVTGIIEQYNDYNMTATKAGLTGWLQPDPTPIDASKDVFIVFYDLVPPTMLSDTSDIAGTTGDPFTFRGNATDDIGIDVITAHYRYGTSGAFNAIDLDYGTPWSIPMNIVSNYVGTMEYYLEATDVGGNTDSTGIASVTITDNDAPSGYVDNTQTVVTPEFVFDVELVDNIGVTNTYLVYWYNADPATNVSMGGTNPYNHTLNIAFALNSTLYYYVSGTDAAGNWFTAPTVGLMILDLNNATIDNDTSDTSASTGDVFEFNITATDDWGIATVNITYSYGTNGTQQIITLTPGPNNTYLGNITIPANSTDDLSYMVIVTDVGGNSVNSTTATIVVGDNDAPTIITDNSDDEATTGDNFDFSVEVDDNIDIDTVEVVYWYGDGSSTTISLAGANGTYDGAITVPGNMVDDLMYYIIVTDSSGNQISSANVAIMVIDNDAPIFISDASDTSGTTGDAFEFSASASDNVGIVDANVFYWFGNGTATEAALDGSSGTYSLTIMIPANSTDELHYYFEFVDGAENSITGNTMTVEVTDNDAPILGADTSGESAVEGDEFTFSYIAYDNLDIDMAYVIYWTDTEDYAFALLDKNGESFTGQIVIPAGDVLHYQVVAVDKAGNEVTGNVVDVTIGAPNVINTDDGTNGLPDFLGTAWWLILIIIILLMLVAYLAMKNRGEDEETEEPEAPVEPEQVEENTATPTEETAPEGDAEATEGEPEAELAEE